MGSTIYTICGWIALVCFSLVGVYVAVWLIDAILRVLRWLLNEWRQNN